MRRFKDALYGFGVGAGAVTGVCLLMGSVKTQTRNVDQYLGALERPLSVACSDNGQVVYIADQHTVFKSANQGDDWQIVLTNGRYTPMRD